MGKIKTQTPTVTTHGAHRGATVRLVATLRDSPTNIL
jgi:hypothetical protein